jgi:hypothetical protein
VPNSRNPQANAPGFANIDWGPQENAALRDRNIAASSLLLADNAEAIDACFTTAGCLGTWNPALALSHLIRHDLNTTLKLSLMDLLTQQEPTDSDPSFPNTSSRQNGQPVGEPYDDFGVLESAFMHLSDEDLIPHY